MLNKNRTVAPWSDAKDQLPWQMVQTLESFCQRRPALLDSITRFHDSGGGGRFGKRDGVRKVG